MTAKNVLCTVRAEGGLVVSSYTFPVGKGTITANTRMTPDEAEAYRFTLAALILEARGGAPRKELVDRMNGRMRLIAAARLPAEPPSDDDTLRTEPVPMHEARALLDYIAKLEFVARQVVTADDGQNETRHSLALAQVFEALGGEARAALGIERSKERSHGTPPVSDPQH